MAADANRRIRHWNRKFDTGRTQRTLDELRQQMLERYAAAVVSLCEMETAVKTVLNQNGVQTVLYVPYLDFGRELFRLSRQQGISGDAFARAAEILIAKWAARGLDPAVLAQIRTGVFDIGAPPAP